MQTPLMQADDQTLRDLNMLSRGSKSSVYSLFSPTSTQGGSVVMEHLFRTPLSDAEAINTRSGLYRFFAGEDMKYPVESESIGTSGFYLENQDVRTQIQPGSGSFMDRIASDPDYAFVQDGVQSLLRVFGQTARFMDSFRSRVTGSPYEAEYNQLNSLVQDPAFAEVLRLSSGKVAPKLPAPVLSELDKTLRFKSRDQVLELLELLHRLDVYITVGQVARRRGFTFGTALPADSGVFTLEGVYHPHVDGAIANDLILQGGDSMLFLTGANMAGKSTLMKALGISVYLGHMGFPVPARSFTFSVRDALYTSINLADNLQAGASHYYAEVLRVKEVATQLAAGKRLFVIFDELFRGTNVKDAHDATLAITKAFARQHTSRFIISTHIMEAGEKLMEERLGIRYEYLPTEMVNGTPKYTRILKSGITDDRHGMVIIGNEGVLEVLDRGLEKQKVY